MSYREDVLYAAVRACNKRTEDQVSWFRHWAHQEPPTTAQMSLTCFVLEYAQVLADNDGLRYHSDPECRGHVKFFNYPGFCENNRTAHV